MSSPESRADTRIPGWAFIVLLVVILGGVGYVIVWAAGGGDAPVVIAPEDAGGK